MKKLLATLLASTMALSVVSGLVACGPDDKVLTVWAPEAAHKVYKRIVKDWEKENEGWTVKFEAKAEGEAETDFGADPAKGADVFFFESGQIATMKQKLYLQTLDAETTEIIKDRDGANANGVIDDQGLAWAFPATADNGYFMWYDKEFFEDVDITSLDDMLDAIDTYNSTAAANAKKTFVFKYDDGWYESSWFFGTGCEMDWIEGTTNYYTDIKSAKGQAAAQASMNYLGREAISTGDDGVVTSGFQNGSVVAAVRGTWIYKTLFELLGEETYNAKIGAARMPDFKVGDTTYHMGSFSGGKFCGVNRYKNNAKSIEKSISLANFLTQESSQLARFKETGAIPSNSKLANSDAVKNDMLAKAFADQMATCSYIQLSQDGLWDAMAEFGTACHDGEVTAANVNTKLADLATAMSKGGTLVETK